MCVSLPHIHIPAAGHIVLHETSLWLGTPTQSIEISATVLYKNCFNF